MNETDWLDWDDRLRLVVHDNSTKALHAEREADKRSTTPQEEDECKRRSAQTVVGRC